MVNYLLFLAKFVLFIMFTYFKPPCLQLPADLKI